ncbi:uncharacterized protein B0T23DRAFT_386113 [Neurospora hispaniola]|uniref:Uncharacterized protein n=1 Tax=Neurospora hispaniola TaxID=588809 RepID=A0AAJ0I1Q9_9PEZI|nr:hypothetical protein B0T23DRAFT_386113 [Neurospora hispaniola]
MEMALDSACWRMGSRLRAMNRNLLTYAIGRTFFLPFFPSLLQNGDRSWEALVTRTNPNGELKRGKQGSGGLEMTYFVLLSSALTALGGACLYSYCKIKHSLQHLITHQ